MNEREDNQHHMIKRGQSEFTKNPNGSNGSGSEAEIGRISFATDKSGVSSSIRKIFEIVKVEPNER